MDKTQLAPVADILVPAYLETASFSRQFRDDHGQPPTMANKVHHLRSVVQAMVNKSERLTLGEPYAEFGRVEITDSQTDHCYLLRSEGAVAIERSKRQGSLFDSVKYLKSTVILLVYRFHREGVDLSVAGTRQQVGRTRLEATGVPSFIGTWPYSLDDDASTFEQGERDPFAELGAMPEVGEEGGEA